MTSKTLFVMSVAMGLDGEATANKLGDGHDFSDQDVVLEHGHAMYENLTGAGTAMPPAGFTQPTAAAKQKFLDWLECSGASAAGADHQH